MAELEYPEGLKYTQDHEWVQVVSDGVVRIGITAYAQDALGDIVYVDLPEVGAELAAGDSCGEVESTKSVSEIYAPVAGEVVAVNDDLADASEKINSDPYTDGWMFEMRLADVSVLDGLMDAEGYAGSLN